MIKMDPTTQLGNILLPNEKTGNLHSWASCRTPPRHLWLVLSRTKSCHLTAMSASLPCPRSLACRNLPHYNYAHPHTTAGCINQALHSGACGPGWTVGSASLACAAAPHRTTWLAPRERPQTPSCADCLRREAAPQGCSVLSSVWLARQI